MPTGTVAIHGPTATARDRGRRSRSSRDARGQYDAVDARAQRRWQDLTAVRAATVRRGVGTALWSADLATFCRRQTRLRSQERSDTGGPHLPVRAHGHIGRQPGSRVAAATDLSRRVVHCPRLSLVLADAHRRGEPWARARWRLSPWAPESQSGEGGRWWRPGQTSTRRALP